MRLLTAVHDDCKAGKAEAAKTDEGTAHQEAKAQPERDSQTTASNLHNDHASNLHILDKSVTGKSDSLDESKEDKTAEAKHDNVDDSQHKTQCNTFTDDPDPTFLFEEVPLESIPLPEGPYIPPETQHCVSLEHEARASASVPDIQPQSEKATKPRKRDIPPEQWLSQDAVSNDKDSISESSIKPTAKCSIETEPKSVKLDERKFTPEVKSQEVTPSKQQLSNKIKEPPQPELSQQSNLPISKKSELDCQRRAARNSKSKHKEKAPVISKQEQHSLPEVQLEVDKVSESKQPPEPTNIRDKLRKLRRESLMSVLNFEPLEITHKTTPIQSFEMKQDGASLCKQAWSRISASQKESAYFSSEDKKVSPEPSRPVQIDKEDSSGKTELCRSQSPSKTENTGVETKGKPSKSSSEKKKVSPEPSKLVQNNKEDSTDKAELCRSQSPSKTQNPDIQTKGMPSYSSSEKSSFEKKKVSPEPSKLVQNNKEDSTNEAELCRSQSPSKTQNLGIQTKGMPSYSSLEKSSFEKNKESPETSKPDQNNKEDSTGKTENPGVETKGQPSKSSSEKEKVLPEPSKPVQNKKKDSTSKAELCRSQSLSKTQNPSIQTKSMPSYSSSEKSSSEKKVSPGTSKPVQNNKEDSTGKTELCRSQSPSKTKTPSVQTKGKPSHSSSEKSSSEKKKVLPEQSKPVQNNKEDSNSKTELLRSQTPSKTRNPSAQTEGKPLYFSSKKKNVLPEPSKPVQNNNEDSIGKTELRRSQSPTQNLSIQTKGKPSYSSSEKKKVLPEPSKPVQKNKEDGTGKAELRRSQSPSQTQSTSIQMKGKPSYCSSEKKNVSPEPSKPVQNNKEDGTGKMELNSPQSLSKTKDPSVQTKGKPSYSSSEKKKVMPEPSKPVENDKEDGTGKMELNSPQSSSKTKDPSVQTKGKPSYSSSEKKKVMPEPSKPVENNKEDSTNKTELRRSQSPSKTQNPSIQTKGKPSYSSSQKKNVSPEPSKPVQNNKEDGTGKMELNSPQSSSKTKDPSVQTKGKPSYSSSEKKKVMPEPSKPVENDKEDSTNKTELRRSQSPSKTKDPSLQTEGKPSPVDSADTVQQRTVVGHSCTTAGQRKSDRFLRRQIQGNVVTQFMPGYLTFGNIIVNPAPPVYPPVRDQANSSSAELSGPPSGNCVQNVISKLEHGPTTLPASFTVEESRAVQNQSAENLVTPTEVSKCADTDSKRSHGNAQSASATTDRVVTDAELLAKRETRDDNKTRKGEPGGLPVKSRGQKDVHKHKEHTAVLSTDLKQATEGQETALLKSSKSTPRKQTQDNTSTQSEDFAAHVPKHVSVIGIATDRDSHTALSPKNEMLSHQTEPENPLPQLQEQICKEGSPTKPTENIAATQMSELQDEDNACRQAQSTKVEARLDKLATNPMEQATALLTESIAPRIIVMQDATSTLDNSNEDKTGESEVNVEQMHHGPDVSQKPNNVPVSLELTESTQSSTVQELDSAVHKCDSLSADVTPVCDLAVPPSVDSPTAANQKVQEPQEVSTKEPSPEPESFAVGELSSAPTAHKQEPEHSHHYEQQKQLDLEPKPLSELQKPEIIISTSGLAERAERESTLPQQDSSVTMSTERISPSLKPTIVVASTSSPSPGGCTTEMKALLPETDYKNTAQELRLNHPSTETSGKTMVHVLENSNLLSDNSEAMSVNDRSPLEQSHKNTHQHGLPRKKQLQVSHEPAGKASGPTLLSAVVSHDKSEKLAANVPEHSLSSLPTESLETKPALYELPPGDNGASACEIPANQSEREPILTKYDNTISSNDNENESASCLNEEESSAQQGELEREYIEETSDLADKLVQPASDVTCDQPLTQAMVADRENLSKDPSMKDRENEETLLSFSQLQRISETIDVTNNVVQPAHHTSTDTAATIQYQFEKDIGTDEARPITAAQPSQGAQTEITSLISKNENVIIKQVISVSSHTSEQFTDGSRESAHLVCGTNQLEMTANDCKRALSVRPPSEDAGDESKILSKEHASTKWTENESLLTQEHDTFKAETAKGEEITASSDYEEMESSAEHSRDQCAQFILGEVRVSAKQGDMDNTTVLGQSEDSACNRVLEVKTDTLQEGVADIVQDLTMTPALEGIDRTSSLLSNQEAMTLSQTDLSHSTEEYRRDSGSELASKDEIKDLQGATADGEQDYMAPPASKDNEDVSAMNQKWASHGQEAADISPIEALPNNSTDKPVFVDRIANLKEGTASAEQHHSARSTSNHVEAESMLLLPTEEKTSMELTNVRSPLLEGREKAKSADAPLLEDGGEQLQESSAVTEHNILAALSARDKSENAQVLLTGQEAHLNMPITQEVNAPIGEKLCEFKMNTPAVQAFASNLRDVSRPTSLENNEVQMSLVHTADEMEKANSVNGESKTNSGDDGDQQLHEVCRAVTEYDTEPASSSMDENLLNQAKQANALPGDDQLQSHALPHEINAAVPPVPNWAQRDEESAGKPAIGLAEVDENEILVITVAEESLSEESRDKADNCQQHDHVNENIPRPTQHSIPSFKNQTTHDKVASVGIVSLPREPDIDGNANMQRNTVIQPEQPGVSPTFDASTESALFASSLEERISTSVAETAIVLSTQAGLEVIEVASVIEVSAEEIILSPDISPLHSCHLTETSQQVSAARTNEQSSQLVSTSEGRAESTAYAVGHPALASCDQGPAEFLITGSCNEELSIIPQAEQEMQDSAAEERGNVADGMSGNGDLLSPEATLNELLCEEEMEPAPPTITDDSSHLQHSQGIGPQVASKLTTSSKAQLAGVNPESQLLPSPTLPQTPLTNPLVVHDERLQSYPEPLSITSSCSHYESTQESLEQPAEDSALQPRDANAIPICGNAPSANVAVSLPSSQAGDEEASLGIPSTEESVHVAVSPPPSQAGNEKASLDILSMEESVDVAVSLNSSQAGNEEASLDFPSTEESVHIALSLPPTQAGNEKASLDILSTEESVDIAVSLPPSQAGNEKASLDILSMEESVNVAVLLASSQAGNKEASLDIPSTEESVQIAVSLPPSQAGLYIHSTEESIHVTKSPPPAVTESTRQVEAEKQLAVFIEQTEPTREDTLAGEEEVRNEEPAESPMPLRKQPATSQLPENFAEECTPLSEQSLLSLSSRTETLPEEHKPKKAAAKPKRRGRTSLAHSQGEGDEAETLPVRRSTRNKKPPERFCF